MNSLFNFLLVIQGFVAAGLVGLVLMQRSEGGGLGIGGGGSPGGLMSARGAADMLTRATKWFAVVFVSLAIVLAALATTATGNRDYDSSLDRSTTTPTDQGQGGELFPTDDGLDGEAPIAPAPAAPTAPADPLADVAG